MLLSRLLLFLLAEIGALPIYNPCGVVCYGMTHDVAGISGRRKGCSLARHVVGDATSEVGD
jgi:hypothetical protein